MSSTWSPNRRSLIAAASGAALVGKVWADEPMDQQTPSPPLTVTGVEAAPDQEGLTPLKSWFDPTDRPTAEVRLNGGGPFRFLVDSAATTTVVSSAAAEALGLTPSGRVMVAGITGSIVMDTATVGELRAGAVRKTDLRVAVSPGGVGVRGSGILGADVFAGRRLMFDIGARSVSIGFSRKAQFVSDRTNMRLRDGVFAEVPGSIGRVGTRVILDTGAQCSIANQALADALRTRETKIREIKNVLLYGLTGDTLAGDAIFIPKLQIGKASIKGAVVMAARSPIFDVWGLTREPTLILGADLLSVIPKFTIDYGAAEFSIGQAPASRNGIMSV